MDKQTEKPGGYVGRYQSYPDLTGKRQAEGGRRLKGEHRARQPNAPLVTVITVCWNSAKTIEQAMLSVFGQSYDNIEYVIVDGGSTDGTVDLLRKHENRIDYFVSEPDDGLYYAMNKGLELAQGEYILMLNSDDWYERSAVEELVAAKDYSGCDFVSALARYVNEEKGQSDVLRPMPFDDSTSLRMTLRHETMLISAELYNCVGIYDTDFRIIADRDLAARLFEMGATCYEVPRALLNFRTTGVSSTNIDALKRERDMLVAKSFPSLTSNELQRLNNPATTTAEDIIQILSQHPDQPKLAKACRALLHDLRNFGAKRWKTNALETIGNADPKAWPKVSVILPFYAAEKTIGLCLDSVLAQSLNELEIICVNDCAIDSSQSIIDEYQSRDVRVKCIQNPRNLGLGASRNAGIRAAHGRYIFHIDPDDTVPPHALEKLYDAARKYDSDMVKGAYKAMQGFHGKITKDVEIRYACGVRRSIVPNTALNAAPGLLQGTEGHWSYLYDAVFARRVPYPTDLKMGQDSIFLVNALARARKITIIPDVVYHYEANPDSAMNSFNARKINDALEWRRRAWHALRDAGHLERGEHLLFSYWSEAFFKTARNKMSPAELDAFYRRLTDIFRMAGYPGRHGCKNQALRAFFNDLLGRYPVSGQIPPVAADKATTLRVATLSTRDHGGAGIGSQRRVAALRRAGVDAQIHSIFKKTGHTHVRKLPLATAIPDDELQTAWRDVAVLKGADHAGLKASEMFSKTGSLTDFRKMTSTFDQADIVHLHWVAGIFDYEHTAVLADKPVAWTLADMNAFTGGCHYSEGCTEYRNDCRRCPLLAEGSNLAHTAWRTKRDAYAKIKNLHVICPSQWLADCARESSLFGDRPIHVVPNAIPVDSFTATNRLVARATLGMPLDRKLVVFGADSLTNMRKGGDILAESMRHLRAMGMAEKVEGVFFGANTLNLGIKVHQMGHVSDEAKMSMIYAAADVFAFPSREDNAPLTVVESMLSGTPVVGFPVGNVPELVTHKDTGYIARYGDARDFAEGLAWALRDVDGTEALERRMRACLKARTHNDPDTAVARHLAVYAEMLKDSERYHDAVSLRHDLQVSSAKAARAQAGTH